jgi:hypothetical protein
VAKVNTMMHRETTGLSFIAGGTYGKNEIDSVQIHPKQRQGEG